MSNLPALGLPSEDHGFLNMDQVRLLANQKLKQLKDMNISKRELAKLHMISSLDDKSLHDLLQHVRAHYFFHQPQASRGGMMTNYRADEVISVVLRDKYKDIPAEEQFRCREFIKNFVYAGGQFLYVKVVKL